MGAAVIGIGAALAVLGIVFGLIGFGSAETTSGAGLMMVGSSFFVGGLLMVALGFILRILTDIADKLEGAVHFEPLEDEHPVLRTETVAAALAVDADVPAVPPYEEPAPVRPPQELAPLDLAPLDETREPPAWFGRKRPSAPPRAGEAAFEAEPEFEPEPAFAPESEPEAEPLPPFRSPLPGAARPEARRAEPPRVEPPRQEPVRQEPPRQEAPRNEPPRVDALRPEPLRPESLRTEPFRLEPARPEPPRVEPVRHEPSPPMPSPAVPSPAEPSPSESARRELPGFLRTTAGVGHAPNRPVSEPEDEEAPVASEREPFLPEPEPEPSSFLSDNDLLAEEPAPAEPSVTVLKSGTIGGMSYTLYSDGSIEADLPDGVLRFASLQALRDHVAGSVARD